MTINSLQSKFQPSAGVFEGVPKDRISNLEHAHKLLAEIIVKILKEQYGLGDISINIAPVNQRRFIMRISEARQDINQPNDTPDQKNMIRKFISALGKFVNPEDEVYSAMDMNGYDVISYRAEELAKGIALYCATLPNAQQYREALQVALHFHQRFEKNIGKCGLN